MSNSKIKQSGEDDIRFLFADFNQCFEQTRHYNNQIIEILKFIVAFYTAVCGLAWGIYQWSISKNVDLGGVIIIALSITLIFGLIVLVFAIRNRVYFVKCMRYVNEQRGFFLTRLPDFNNMSDMPVSIDKPAFFNWFSSQSWLIYLMSSLNSLILGLLLFILAKQTTIGLVGAIILCIVQLLGSILYLRSKDKGND